MAPTRRPAIVPPHAPRLDPGLALALILGLGLLGGCGENPQPSPLPGSPPPADTAEEAEPPPAAPAITPETAPVPNPQARGYTLRDRVVAVVDEEAILLSDLEQVIGLGLAEPRPGEAEATFRARVLEGLIDQLLRFQVVDRFGFQRVAVERIEAQVAQIEAQFPDRAAFLRRLGELDLGEEELRQLVARQLMVLNYVEERLGARVFVSLDDIRTYYEQELAPAMRGRGEQPPPLETVREEIRATLKEQRLNQEIVRWTDDLRREADVRTFLDEPVEPLPPVVRTVESP